MHGSFGGPFGRSEGHHGPGGPGFGHHGFGHPGMQENNHDSHEKGTEQDHGKFTALLLCQCVPIMPLFQPRILSNMRANVAR